MADDDGTERAQEIWQTVVGILEVCRTLPADDRLLATEMAWQLLAQQGRAAQLAIPGGFPAEQARQLGLLEKMASYVRDDVPDLEVERLVLEGDVEGLVRRMRELKHGDSTEPA